MAKRPRHTRKEIEDVIRHAEGLGWTFEISYGHAFGRLYCPEHTRDGCQLSVWSTPRNADGHARQIMAAIKRCDHCHEDGGDG